jgi:hypothetical protein
MWRVEEKTIGELIKLVDDSNLALPQFQRPSVWGKSNWIPFLVSILQGRPTGTLLLMEADDTSVFSPRKLDTSPDLITGRMEYLLLDGQQRTTTIYRAVRTSFGTAPKHKKVVVNVLSAIDRAELTEDDLTIESAAAISATAEMAKKGVVSFATLVDEQELAIWFHTFWTKHFGGDPGKGTKKLHEAIPGFKTVGSYRFPVLAIKKDTPLDVVADIFESMNRRGQALNKFDLMVARLFYQQEDGSYFDLREKWEMELESSTYLKTLGVKSEDGMLPLQLIAKQVSRLPIANRQGKVKGLNSGDVLELPATQVMGGPSAPLPALSLKEAVAALESAAKFLFTICGVVSSTLLPQQAMLLPLADQFLRPKEKQLTDAQLKKWFFSVGLSIDYYGSVNSYADRDCNQLFDWVGSPQGKQPESVSRLNRALVQGLDLQRSFTREGNILGSTIFSLLVERGALDWSEGMIPVRQVDEIDFHHMIPDQRLKDWFGGSKESRRPIACLTPIRSSTNKSIGQKFSKDVVADRGKEAAPIMSSHQVDMALLCAASDDKNAYQKFLDDREKRLKAFIIESLGL